MVLLKKLSLNILSIVILLIFLFGLFVFYIFKTELKPVIQEINLSESKVLKCQGPLLFPLSLKKNSHLKHMQLLQ